MKILPEDTIKLHHMFKFFKALSIDPYSTDDAATIYFDWLKWFDHFKRKIDASRSRLSNKDFEVFRHNIKVKFLTEIYMLFEMSSYASLEKLTVAAQKNGVDLKVYLNQSTTYDKEQISLFILDMLDETLNYLNAIPENSITNPWVLKKPTKQDLSCAVFMLIIRPGCKLKKPKLGSKAHGKKSSSQLFQNIYNNATKGKNFDNDLKSLYKSKIETIQKNKPNYSWEDASLSIRSLFDPNPILKNSGLNSPNVKDWPLKYFKLKDLNDEIKQRQHYPLEHKTKTKQFNQRVKNIMTLFEHKNVYKEFLTDPIKYLEGIIS